MWSPSSSTGRILLLSPELGHDLSFRVPLRRTIFLCIYVLSIASLRTRFLPQGAIRAVTVSAWYEQ